MTTSPRVADTRHSSAAATALAVALTAVGLVLTAPAPPADALRCTITGTSSADVLRGTDGNDVICGLGGDDVLISGGGREDLLRGGAGDDRLESGTSRYSLLDGGDGNDRLVGGSGQDSLRGGGARDVLLGGGGNDGLFGGGGNDDLDGQGGKDAFRWEPGADTIQGGPGVDDLSYYDAPRRVEVSLDSTANDGVASERDDVADDVDWVFGSKFADTLTGNAGANRLSGFDGQDLVEGRGGDDVLEGNNDDDELYGGPGEDSLIGGDLDDLMVGGDGADLMNGAGGNTQSSEDNACDDDPADTVKRCTQDSAAPLFYAWPTRPSWDQGDTFTFEEVRVVDAAGVREVELTTTFDGVPVPWCSGPMDVAYAGPGGTAVLVDMDCPIPADAASGAYEMVFSGTDRLGHHGDNTTYRRYGFMVGTTPETDPPVVTEVSVARASYAAGDRVRVTVRAGDPSGISQFGIYLHPSVDSDYMPCPRSGPERTGGTMAEGVWTLDCRLSGNPPLGTWYVDVDAVDTHGNFASADDAATFEVVQ